MKRFILLIPLLLVVFTDIRAQGVSPSTLNASGGTVIIGSDEVDWSVGEMTLVNTLTAGSIVVTQGVLQPADITEGIPNHAAATQALRVFPTPATSEINLQYAAATDGSLSYNLRDMAGRTTRSLTLAYRPGDNRSQINISGLPTATYMLEVIIAPTNAPVEKYSYKIEKLN